MAVAVVGILVFMVIPLPTVMLDLLLAFNITGALVILLSGMYILKPLEMSSFPSILLLATLFRLSLNIASTRIILLHGHEGVLAAGKVIKAFGGFVVGGNYVVGIIVFLILVLINFMVITKGAGRIAEVAARFTLDAMPGKQMSIDADLNAGIINDEEAKTRRELIAREAEYYGSMDGAMKFVKGDAIAGIIITVINIIGGLVIGVAQRDLGLAVALECTMGYLILSNGVPIGYGGASALFRQVNTGINIFDEFRHSEAAFLWTQVMRVYHALTGCTRFIANAYQFGGDNREALQSGAFWFYYRLGFRPVDGPIRALARAEAAKIRKRPGYRSNVATLKRLASCDMHLTLPGAKARRVTAQAASQGAQPVSSAPCCVSHGPLP